MSVEIEKKYRLGAGDRERIVDELKALGADYLGRDLEENLIYSSDDLRRRNAVVRIRKLEDGALLTYKRRIQTEFDVKEQVEHEVRISNAETVSTILHELGLQQYLIYEKRRDTWKLGSVEVVIDELPFGLFMEIEGTVAGIKEAEMLLDIGNLETEHDTYPALTARFGQRVGEVVEARFS